MKITLAQLNPVVGDVRGNLQKVVATLEQEHLLKNAFGFGGCNACLVLRRVA